MKNAIGEAGLAFVGGVFAGAGGKCVEEAGKATWKKVKTTKFGKKINSYLTKK